jgi:hypothetical protein
MSSSYNHCTNETVAGGAISEEYGALFNLLFAQVLFWAIGLPLVVEYGYDESRNGDQGERSFAQEPHFLCFRLLLELNGKPPRKALSLFALLVCSIVYSVVLLKSGSNCVQPAQIINSLSIPQCLQVFLLSNP